MEELVWQLAGLTVFRGAAELPPVAALRDCLRAAGAKTPDAEAVLGAYARVLYTLREAGERAFAPYLRAQLAQADTAYARAVARGEERACDDADAARDLAILSALCTLPVASVKAAIADALPAAASYAAALPEWDTGEALRLDALKADYRRDGCGIFSRARAFRWEKGTLTQVCEPDPVGPMIGYEWQREAVRENTRALLAGRPCCNVLLHGESGTGKSATIKSLLREPEFTNLRIIELAKNSLEELTALEQLVSGHTQKFVLYIDDLAFREDDRGYSALKTALEGGLERQPENVVIYVTSNRRHMVRETFTERGSDELHRAETIAEQTSLSDRFGLRLPYLSLDRAEYLRTVEFLAAQAGLAVDSDTLRAEANAWELRHGGRTPRTAAQFIEHLQSKT